MARNLDLTAAALELAKVQTICESQAVAWEHLEKHIANMIRIESSKVKTLELELHTLECLKATASKLAIGMKASESKCVVYGRISNLRAATKIRSDRLAKSRGTLAKLNTLQEKITKFNRMGTNA